MASYKIVLRNPWARIMLLAVGLEGALFQGVFPYVSADLHLRFGLSFTAIGIIIGVFAIGGLIYAATVRPLMRRLGQTGIANAGGVLMGLSFLTLAVEPVWHFAPLATLGIGLGFFMLHNTLQTEATQMTPEARGTSVALFASMYFIGQTVGVALAAPVMDRYGARPLFVVSAVLLPALAFWFTRRLKRKSLAAPARDPFDLGLDDALDHARQVVVEPGLEQRPQHLPHQVFERAGVLHQHGLGQRVEGGIDRRRRGATTSDRRGRAWRAAATARGSAAAALRPRGGGGSGWRRRIGEDHVGLAVDGLEARRLGLAGCRHLLGQFEHVFGGGAPARRRIEPGQHRIDVALIHRGGGGGAARRRGRRRRRHRIARRHARRDAAAARPAAAQAWRGGLGGVVVGDDAANGGEDFLHRRLLRLRRLAHCRIPTVPIPQSPRDAG